MKYEVIYYVSSWIFGADGILLPMIVDEQRYKSEQISIKRGRLAMMLLAVLGTIPVFLGPEVLSATTVSGTMVIGLAPVFICWKAQVPPLGFHLSVWTGIIIGAIFAFGWIPKGLIFFEGTYGDLLSVNLWGTALCFFLFFGSKWMVR